MSLLDLAARDAGERAQKAGVEIRELRDLPQAHAMIDLLLEIWGRPLITVEFLRALARAGNYAAGAYDGDRLVGVCIGFHEEPAARTLHSHVAGVAPGPGGPRRRPGAQAPPARLGPGPRHPHDRVDLRPAGQPQRLFQHRQAGGAPGGVPHQLLRRDARRDQRRRRHRPPARALGPALAEGRGRLFGYTLRAPGRAARRAAGSRPRPTSRPCVWTTSPAAVAWRRRVRDELEPLMAAGGRVVDFDLGRGYLVELETS